MRTKADVGLDDRQLYEKPTEPAMTDPDPNNIFEGYDVIVCYGGAERADKPRPSTASTTRLLAG